MKSAKVCFFMLLCTVSGFDFDQSAPLFEGDECKTRQGVNGICRVIRKCPQQLHIVSEFPSKFWPKICGFEGIDPIVCCPHADLRPSERACRQIEEDLENGNLDIIDARVKPKAETSKTSHPHAPRKDPPQQAHQGNNASKTATTKGPPLQQDTPKPKTGSKEPPQVPPSNKTSVNPMHRKVSETISRPNQASRARVTTLLTNLTDRAQSIGMKVQRLMKQLNPNETFFVHGGFEVPIGTHRHMVALGYLNNVTYDWLCGGSLISETFVLTAAHCVVSLHRRSPDIAWVGVHDLRSKSEGIIVPVEDVIVHPLYLPTLRYHDIALLKLKKLKLGRIALPACLSSHLDDPEEMTILGWGSTEIDGGPQSPILQTALLEPVPESKCNESYAGKSYLPTNLRLGITGTMICAKGSNGLADACQGDSGGPLQIPRKLGSPLFTLVGVTSFGKLCGGIGVYTRIASYLEWIESEVWPTQK